MRSSRKIATGTGLAGIIVALVHIFHGLHSLSSSSGPTFPKPSDIKRVEFIISDSLGNRDTMYFDEYMRRSDSLKRKQFKLEKAMVDTVVMRNVGGKLNHRSNR